MRARSYPSRLELHRLKYNQSGRRGPLLTLSELEDHEKEQLNREILQDVRVARLDFTGDMDEDIFDRVQAEVFSEWGVMCPHHNVDAINETVVHIGRCRACGSIMPTVLSRKTLVKSSFKKKSAVE